MRMPSRVLEDAVTDPATSALRMQSSSAQWGSSALFFFLGGLLVLVIFLILILILRKRVNPSEVLKLVAGINKQRGSQIDGVGKVDNILDESTTSEDFLFYIAASAELFSGNLRTVSYFDFQTLKKAANNFHPDHLFGKGGFGPVYLVFDANPKKVYKLSTGSRLVLHKGKLEHWRLVAVKKLSIDTSRQGESEFLAEVRSIASIQHRNLVRLLGCCYDGPQRLLVYEYLKNRSLDLILYGKSNKFLNWSTRFQIIVGIARGLQYLHEDSHFRIVQRDIKASNILLDDKFQPRIGDLGLAWFFPEDQSYLSTAFAETIGYTAPEYAIRGESSEKADIYSFGVLVLEIIGSRKNTDFSLASEMQYLPEYAWKLDEGSRVLDLVDPNMREYGFVETDVLLAIHVAFLCLQNHANLRPPMSEIVALLTCKFELDKTPPRPIFLDRRSKMNLSWDIISDALPSKVQSESLLSPKTLN